MNATRLWLLVLALALMAPASVTAQEEKGPGPEQPPVVQADNPPPPLEGGPRLDAPRPEGRRRLGPGPQGPQGPRGPQPPADQPPGPMRERVRERLEQPLSPEEEARALEVIRTQRPWEMERVERLKAERPLAYTMMLRQALLGERMMDRLRQEDPEALELRKRELDFERQEHELAQAYQRATDEKEKKAIEGQLKEVLGKHFDLRSENHKREIKRAEEELARLRERLATREKNRAEIIENMSLRLRGLGDTMEF